MGEATVPGSAGEQAQAGSAGEAAGAQTLRRHALRMPEVLAQSVANAAPSAAMALLPLIVFLSAGYGSWLSFLITALIMLCVAYCAVAFARNMTSAGSFYVWVRRALGPAAGHAAGWGLVLGYICIGILTVLGFGIFGGDFLDRLGLPGASIPVQIILYLVGFAIAVTVALHDVRLATRVALVLETISIAAILTLCVVIWVHHGNVIDLRQLTLTGSTGGGIIVGVVIGILAFTGFESAGCLGMEAKNPYKSVGRAILWSAAIVGAFYVIVSYSQVYGFQGASQGFAKSQAPMPDLAGIVGLGFLSYIIDLGICCSMVACTLACINAASRMVFTAAHDGLTVAAFGRTHPVHKTPHIGIWWAAILMVAPSIGLVLAYRDPVSAFNWISPLAAFGCMVGYALISIAAPVFMFRAGRRWLPSAAFGTIGLTVMVVVFYVNWLPHTIPGELFPSLVSPYDVMPYVLFGWIALGLLDYFRLKARNPGAARMVGQRFEVAEEPEPPVERPAPTAR
ncbi:MAG: APC family permease [Streptosporangiaceae bacterium]